MKNEQKPFLESSSTPIETQKKTERISLACVVKKRNEQQCIENDKNF